MAFSKLTQVQREYLATYEVLDPQVSESVELLKAGVSFQRILALYPLDLGQLTRHFVNLVGSEDQLPAFLELMKDSGLKVIHDRVSSEVLDQLFLMPDRLDFSFPEMQKLTYASYPKHDYLALMNLSPLEDALIALADSLWLGSRWHHLPESQAPFAESLLVNVLRKHRAALQALDAATLTAVS